jgi:benzodiazapine receptor
MIRFSSVRLACFIICVVGVGLTVGALNIPGAWYSSLAKPAFNPPNWIFAPAWTVLYLLIAIAGERISRKGWAAPSARLWLAQLVTNFFWSPIFFSLHSVGTALAVIALLLALIIAFMVSVVPIDRISAILFVPYAAWVSFALLLNYSIWTLNK